MGYASGSDVAALCQNILGTRDGFTSSTCPTYEEVNTWLSSGCAVLEGRLLAEGYTVPAASTTTAYFVLKDLNAFYAAARVELSRTNITLAPGERTRGQVFDEMFWEGLDRFLSGDLSGAGITRSSAGKLYVGGISVTDKRSNETDTDRVQPRFRRGQFDFPGKIGADVIGAS